MVTNFPDPAELYPDVAAYGSLAAALEAAADAQGIDIGVIEVGRERMAGKPDLLRCAAVTSKTSLRDSLKVDAGHAARFWSIRGWGQGIELVQGKTLDLADIPKVALLWRDGAPLLDIARLAPFVELCRLAVAAEQGPEQVVAEQWEYTRQEARTAKWLEHQALVEAAYREPKLRQLYPYTSHWVLRFSTTTGFRFSPDYVALVANPGKPYVVKKNWHGASPRGDRYR